MDYSALRNKLYAWNMKISPNVFDEALLATLRQILDSNEWGFLFDSSQVLRAPKLLTGEVIVTQFSADVVIPAGDLKDILDNLGVNDVPIDTRQFRTDTGTEAPRRIYNILSYTTGVTGTLTLDEPYWDADDGTIPAKIFKGIYTMPQRNIAPLDKDSVIVSDFRQLECVIDLRDQRQLNLDINFAELNRYDPSRWNYASTPSCLVPAGVAADGQIKFELYPYYSDGSFDRYYKIIYIRRGRLFEQEADSLPYYIDERLLLEGAKIRVCEWAEANKGNIPELKATNWLALRAVLSGPDVPQAGAGNFTGYKKMLDDAMRLDEAAFPKDTIRTLMDCPYYNYPFGPIVPFPYGYNFSFNFTG